LVGKLDSFIGLYGQSELSCEEFNYNELCDELKKMKYWQNSVEIAKYVVKDVWENVAIEEETEYELGLLSFDYCNKSYKVYFRGKRISAVEINGSLHNSELRPKILDYLFDLVG
jgi:hypothetical protein